MEGGTGAAYSDENGITVSLMARQFELPREVLRNVDLTNSSNVRVFFGRPFMA